MKDWLFFPLATVVIIVMIVFALSFGKYEAITVDEAITVSGGEFDSLVVAPGTTMTVATDAQRSETFAIMSAHAARENAPSAGIFISIPQEYQKAYYQKRIYGTVRARDGRNNPVGEMELAFFMPGKRTGWQSFELTDEFQDFTIEFVPSLPTSQDNFMFFGIWPDRDGSSRTIEVERVEVGLTDGFKSTAIVPRPDQPQPPIP